MKGAVYIVHCALCMYSVPATMNNVHTIVYIRTSDMHSVKCTNRSVRFNLYSL